MCSFTHSYVKIMDSAIDSLQVSAIGLQNIVLLADWKLLMSSCYIFERCSPSVSMNSVKTDMKTATEELSPVAV